MTTILVVDDDHSLCRALFKGLGAHGYDVVTAMTGHEAITLAAKTYPDLLLVDLGLPQLSSIEVITAVRGWSSAPIIVLSARPGEVERGAALNAGADDFLAKPFGINELLARIGAALRRSASTGEESVIVAGDLSIDLGSRRDLGDQHLGHARAFGLEHDARSTPARAHRQRHGAQDDYRRQNDPPDDHADTSSGVFFTR